MTKYIVLVLLATNWAHYFGELTDISVTNETDSSSATVHIAASNFQFPAENGEKAMSGTSLTVE